MNSTDNLWIQSNHSSLVVTCDVSHACLRCCWLTVIFVGSDTLASTGWTSLQLQTMSDALDRRGISHMSICPYSNGRRSPLYSFVTRLSYFACVILWRWRACAERESQAREHSAPAPC